VLAAVAVGALAAATPLRPAISSPATSVVVSLSPPTLAANGLSTTIATATITDAGAQPVAGQEVVFKSSDPGNAIGTVAETAPGIYTATITASTTPGEATITATDGPAAISGQTVLQQQQPRPAALVSVSTDPGSVVADGSSTATAAAIVTDENGNRVPGDHVAFSSSDGAEMVGATIDAGNGVYTAVVTSSTSAHEVTITATDSTPLIPATGKGTLNQVAGPAENVSVTLSPASIPADGSSSSLATATVTDHYGNPVSGEAIGWSSTDTGEHGEQIGGFALGSKPGTYQATITSSTRIGSATITATDTSVAPFVRGEAILTQTVRPTATVVVSLAPPSIVADGAATTTATATVTDAGGHPLTAETVKFASSDPAEAVGATVINHGDGTYTDTIRSSTRVGTAEITAEDAGYHVSGHVILTQTVGPAASVAVSLSPAKILANGVSTTSATATVTDAEGHRVSGDAIAFSSTDAGNAIGATVVDHGDGTYTDTIRSSTTVGSPEITATDTGAGVSGHVTLTQTVGPAASVTVSLSPPRIVADGQATTTATATVTDAEGHRLSGEAIAFTSTDNGEHGEQIGGVGPGSEPGTYQATITSSTRIGSATITATDTSTAPSVRGEAVLTQTVGPVATVTVSLSPASIFADGVASSTATATVTDAERHGVAGETIVFKSTDAGNAIGGTVVDHGDGTYTDAIRSSTTVGVPEITATDTGAGVSGHVTLTQTVGPAANVTVSLSPSSIVADGVSTATATATVTDAAHHPLTHDVVSFSSSDTGDRIGATSAHGDGTYSAPITSSTTVGEATISATDRSVAPAAHGQAMLKHTVGPAASVVLALSPSSIVADGSSTTQAVIEVRDAQGRELGGQSVELSSSDSGIAIGHVEDRNGVYYATLTSSLSVHAVTVTAQDSSVSPTVQGAITLDQTAGPAAQVLVGLSPSSVPADGSAASTATAIVTDAQGHRLPNLALSFHTSDPADGVQAITDRGDGSYGAQIISSTKIHPVIVTAVVISVMPQVSGSATLSQTLGAPALITLSLTPSTVPADGMATTTATAAVFDAGGHALARQPVALFSSDAAVGIGAVSDRGDGSYLATVRSSRTPHAVTVTAIDSGVSPTISGSATLTEIGALAPPGPCRVPRLLRLSRARALRALRGARCSQIAVHFHGARGVVLRQSIPPATIVTSRTGLTLALGAMPQRRKAGTGRGKSRAALASVPPRDGSFP
jgi:adhesin/invasin